MHIKTSKRCRYAVPSHSITNKALYTEFNCAWNNIVVQFNVHILMKCSMAISLDLTLLGVVTVEHEYLFSVYLRFSQENEERQAL